MTYNYKRFSLRLPVSLHNLLEEKSISDRRTMNETIVILLEYGFKEKTRKRAKKDNTSDNSTNSRSSNAG